MNLPQDAEFKAPAPRTPAPRIDPVFVWPTPNENDFLFYVEHNGDLPVNKTWEYGSAYLDPIKYPNHKLVYVSPQTPDKWSKWYYAAEREAQDEYNWSVTNANIAGFRFDAVAREYVFTREEFIPDEPLMGTAMPDIPLNKFDADFVLAERQQIPTPDVELNSIFIFEKRLYVKRCTITTIQTEDFFGIGGSKVDTWYYRGELVDGTAVETRFAAPNSAFWGWQADGTQRDGIQVSDHWFIISVISSILDVIDDYVFSYPTLTNINLPRILVDSQLTFNVNKGEGNQDQDGWSFSYGELPISASLGLTDSCSSSVSISPELGLSFEDPDGSYTPAMVYAFFLPQPVTMADIISSVSTLHGSAVTIYEPPTTSTSVITLVSASASVRASATGSLGKSVKSNGGSDAQEKSVSTDKSVSQSTQFLQISGFIGSLSIDESLTDEVSATASVSFSGSGFAEGANVSALITDSATATSSVTASGSGGSINLGSGAFITSVRVEYYRFQRAKIFVEVVDLD